MRGDMSKDDLNEIASKVRTLKEEVDEIESIIDNSTD
jgi:outer membrane murein-binding lipoprotein Lpp